MAISIRHLFARSVWLKIHLYLALSLGLLFALQGLTGSLSVYRQELDSVFNPQQHIIAPPQAQALSLDKIIAAVRQAHPDRHGVWTLELPRKPDQVITAWFEKPRETFDAFYAPLMVAVNPYTGEVIENRFWGQTLTTWLLDLHTQLRLEATGRDLVAVLAVLLILSVSSGLYLWWPRTGWRQAFNLRVNAGLSRLLIDLHRWLGLLSSVFLLLLAFTGFHLAYPSLIEALTASSGMGHGDEGPNVRSTAIPNDRPISLTEAVLVARGPFSQSEVRRVSTPLGDTGTYRINLRQKNEINQHHPITTVWVDRWSGQIRDVRNPSKFTAAQTFTVWLWPLHTGEAFGELGRLIWFLVGLMPLILYISGIYYWLQRKGLVRDRPVHFAENSQKIRQFSQQAAIHIWTVLRSLSLKLIELTRR